MISRDMMMDAITALLHMVEEEISPANLSGKHLSAEQISEWQAALGAHARVLRKGYMLEQPDKLSERLYFLGQLIGLSNILQHYLFRVAAMWQDHPHAETIKRLYVEARNAIELLIDSLIEAGNDQAPDLPISRFSLGNVILALKADLQRLRHHLEFGSADPLLIKLLLGNLYSLIRKRHFTYQDAVYVRSVCGAVMEITPLNTDRLREVLATWNFNSPEFFMYWVNDWQQRLAEIAGLHEQLEMISLEQEKVNNLRLKTRMRMLEAEQPLKDDLYHFLEEKGHLLKQLIKLRRILLKDNDLARTASRLRINLPVAQFALFIRLQIETGLLPKENVGQIFTFFAAHYSTKQALFISAESLQKKSTDVEFLTAQKMKGQLITMVNWLNEHYNATD